MRIEPLSYNNHLTFLTLLCRNLSIYYSVNRCVLMNLDWDKNIFLVEIILWTTLKENWLSLLSFLQRSLDNNNALSSRCGEGKRRKEFAEWYVAWRAEWHNYAKYDLRRE